MNDIEKMIRDFVLIADLTYEHEELLRNIIKFAQADAKVEAFEHFDQKARDAGLGA